MSSQLSYFAKLHLAKDMPRHVWLNLMVLMVLTYFIFHSIYGARGVISYFRLKSELTVAHAQLEELRGERLEIENRAKLLRSDSLDLDMLEEKAKNILGLARPGEKIVTPNSVIMSNDRH
jgi:cell division protein FtsB